MDAVQKLLLTLAAVCMVIGIPVTFSHAEAAPFWALALPMGAVFLGMFLISLLWQREMAKFDEEERSKTESASRRSSPVSYPGNQRPKAVPPAAEVPAHSRA